MNPAPLILALAALLAGAIPAFSPAQAQPQPLNIRLEPLSLQADLNAVAASGEYVIAVGKGGAVAVWRGGRLDTLSVAPSDLLDVSCGAELCVAVGGRGTISEISPRDGYFRTSQPAPSDAVSVSMGAGVAAVAAGTEVIIYRPGRGVEAIADLGDKVSSVEWDGSAFVAAAGSKIFAVKPSGEYQQIAAFKAGVKKAFRIGGQVYALVQGGLARGDQIVAGGSFADAAQAGRGILLVEGHGVSLYDIHDGRLVNQAVFDSPVSSASPYGAGLVVAGPAGFLALFRDGSVGLLAAPRGDYVDAVWDGRGSAVIASKTGFLLKYDASSATFTKHIVGDSPKSMAAAGGDVVVLGSRGLWVFDGGEVRPAAVSIRASDFNDVAPSANYWVTLVGPGGRIVEVGRGGETAPVKATSNALLAAARGFAVGDKVAVVLGPQPAVSNQDSKLVDVDLTPCGAVAVSDTGQVVHLTRDRALKATVGKLKLSRVSVNPRGAYAIAGGAKGELVYFDGYNATLLAAALPEEVRAIAWMDAKAAVVATPSRLYRLVEVGFPPPSVEVVAPKRVEVFAGASKRIDVELRPLNGFTGEASMPVHVTGPVSQYASASPANLKVDLQPLCPARASLTLAVAPESPELQGTLLINFRGSATSVALSVRRPLETAQQPAPLESLMPLAQVAAIVVIAAAAAAAFRSRFGKKKGAEQLG